MDSSGESGKSPQCEDPACVDGMIALDPDDLRNALDAVENYVMGVMFNTHEAGEANPVMLQDLVEYLLPLPREFLVDVLLSIADGAAGLFIEYEKLGGNGGIDESVA